MIKLANIKTRVARGPLKGKKKKKKVLFLMFLGSSEAIKVKE